MSHAKRGGQFVWRDSLIGCFVATVMKPVIFGLKHRLVEGSVASIRGRSRTKRDDLYQAQKSPVNKRLIAREP